MRDIDEIFIMCADREVERMKSLGNDMLNDVKKGIKDPCVAEYELNMACMKLMNSIFVLENSFCVGRFVVNVYCAKLREEFDYWLRKIRLLEKDYVRDLYCYEHK